MPAEPRHTPGPWVPTWNGEYWQINTDAEGWRGQQIGDACASQWMYRSADHSEDHSEANARLMAAAPEMLEALKDAVRMLEAVRYTAGLGKRQLERLEKAKAIIDKAEGR